MINNSTDRRKFRWRNTKKENQNPSQKFSKVDSEFNQTFGIVIQQQWNTSNTCRDFRQPEHWRDWSRGDQVPHVVVSQGEGLCTRQDSLSFQRLRIGSRNWCESVDERSYLVDKIRRVVKGYQSSFHFSVPYRTIDTARSRSTSDSKQNRWVCKTQAHINKS